MCDGKDKPKPLDGCDDGKFQCNMELGLKILNRENTAQKDGTTGLSISAAHLLYVKRNGTRKKRRDLAYSICYCYILYIKPEVSNSSEE